ncbi:MAG TPA: hypothetical protein PK052_10750 [Anaerohalosphaeraceae bacterium]|nr:hypothetical protein [Anaerohalosphaeraceae bacterium]HOL32449.1 hypothetical protein [Anaerohalosphaeraceae bacterium]HOM75842.1 hypothetical protein [Anaerohalosphaeraceae bacterium]HPC64854.1 hypothetical protein [Anaerohalosphaeraceae bacterium]HRV19671.1 hypothetical protein [Anaerohalosphaeraceae bacterium]
MPFTVDNTSRMEAYWNKKRIFQLHQADPSAIERFFEHFGPWIYTWLYYQTGADPQIALELTDLTFRRIILNITSFDTAKQSLSQWLMEQAKLALSEGMAGRQIQPQRPWAWSQLPEHILQALAGLRFQAIPDTTAAYPFVQELVQAALAEMDANDRELMIYRYHHLDMPEHIAEQMGIRIEEVNNRLYRCRHSFRRIFTQLLSAANPAFSESSATGSIELLDSNLEKLLSSTAIYQTPSPAQRESILSSMLEAARQAAQNQPPKRLMSRTAAIIGIAVIFIILAAAAGILRSLYQKPSAPPAVSAVSNPSAEKEPKKIEQPTASVGEHNDPEKEKLKQVFELGQAGNLDALLEILKSGHFAGQMAAAHFIGKLGEPSAIALLEQAQMQWYPNGPSDNPFANAIKEILSRHPEAAKPVEPAKTEPNKTEEKTALPPLLTGKVIGITGIPIAGAKLELLTNPLFAKQQPQKAIAAAQTDSNGNYHLAASHQGPAFLICKIQGEPPLEVMQAVWCSKDNTCIVNIGGQPSLTGSLTLQGNIFAGQRLILSNTVDYTDASFRAEFTTDAQGNFSLGGIPAGTYYLFHKQADQHLLRLAVFELPLDGSFHFTMDLQPVRVLLDYPANETLPVKAALACAPGILEVPAVISEDGQIIFSNIYAGSYWASVQLSTGVWIQQEVTISSEPAEQVISIAPVLQGNSVLSGRFLSSSTIDLCILNPQRRIRIDLKPAEDGTYLCRDCPADIYSIAAFFNGQFIEFLQIDLQEQSEIVLDIDPQELIRSRSPLYAVAADTKGLIIGDAQIWLTGTEELVVTQTTGRGAFLAAPAGRYMLSAACPGYLSAEQSIELRPSMLTAQPDPDNTILIRLENTAHQNTP